MTEYTVTINLESVLDEFFEEVHGVFIKWSKEEYDATDMQLTLTFEADDISGSLTDIHKFIETYCEKDNEDE